jgi:23S rRNA (adenine-N6)-dimethyltransferase
VWYELLVVRRLPRGCFEPPPPVDGGLLRIVRRPVPLVSVRDAEPFRAFVRAGFEHGLPRTRASKRSLRALGLGNARRPRELDVHQWAALFDAVRRSG